MHKKMGSKKMKKWDQVLQSSTNQVEVSIEDGNNTIQFAETAEQSWQLFPKDYTLNSYQNYQPNKD